MSAEDERKAKFLVAEYRESANAYFEGANMGWTGLRLFITINATFAAAFSVLAGLKDQPTIVGHATELSPFFALGFAFAPIILCVAILFVRKHYFDHLENCRLRCEQLESEWGGQLFTRMRSIETDSRFHSTHVVNLIVACTVVLWSILVAYILILPGKL